MRWLSGLVLLLAGCGIETPDVFRFSSGTTATGTGSGGLTAVAIWTSDSPLEDVDAVNVTFDRVELIRGDTTLVLLDRRRRMDLLQLQNGVRRILTSARVKPGTYNTLRIELATAGGIPNSIETGGELVPLFLAPGAAPEFVFEGPFRLRPDEELELQLDFNVRLSVFEASGIWYLAPQGELHDPKLAGAVEGTALPAGSRISAQVDGREIASTSSGPDGFFRIFPLRGGTYDLVANRQGHTPQAEPAVRVTRTATTGGHHFLLESGTDAGSLSGVYVAVGGRGLLAKLVWNGSMIGVAGIDPQTGAFHFDDVPSGEAEVVIWDPTGPLGERMNVLVEPGIDALLQFR